MSTYVAIGLINAVSAGILALLVLGITRIWKNPRLAYGLWMIVLLKLITPPVVNIPLRFTWQSEVAQRESGPDDRPGAMPDSSTVVGTAQPGHAEAVSTEAASTKLRRDPNPLAASADDRATPLQNEPTAQAPTAGQAITTGPAPPTGQADSDPAARDPTTADSTTIDDTALYPKAVDPTAVESAAVDETALDESTLDPTAAEPAAVDATELAHAPLHEASRDRAQTPLDSVFSKLSVFSNFQGVWFRWLGILWLVGSALWCVVACWRMVRFHRLLASSQAAPTAVYQLAVETAASIGLRKVPRLKVVDSRLSPMVWPLGRSATVILPRCLLESLSQAELRPLLAHEFAHLVRRDHWVRWFELLVSAAYWWNPVLWLARKEIHTAEEILCDALVMQRCCRPGTRDYADALLKVAEFCAGQLEERPALASGIGTKRQLKGRIEMLVHDKPPRRLARSTKLLVAALALVVLPLSAGEMQKTADRVTRLDHTDTSVETPPPETSGESATAAMAETPATPEATLQPESPDDDPASETLETPPGALTPAPPAEESAPAQPDKRLGGAMMPPEPEELVPGSLIKLRVIGTAPDAPLQDVFLVEPEGTISLGPRYGRAQVVGLTVEEAEKAIATHLEKYLQEPVVQVSRWDGTFFLRQYPVPKHPYKIAAEEFLDITVLGANQAQPIAGDYPVEHSGKVALGPSYGRVRVEGLTLEEAEVAIKKHLSRILKDPLVAVTLGNWRQWYAPASKTSARNRTAAPPASPLVPPTYQPTLPAYQLPPSTPVEPIPTSVVPAQAPMSPELLQLMRDHVQLLEEQYATVKNLYEMGARGGEAEKLYQTEFLYHTKRAELRLAMNQMKDAMDSFNKALAAAEKGLEVAQNAYKSGTVTLSDMIEAQQNYFEAKRQILTLRAPHAEPLGPNPRETPSRRNEQEENEQEENEAIEEHASLTQKQAVLRYAGKTFQQWREVLDNDLEPRTREEAARAIAVLGQHGNQQEAILALGPLLHESPKGMMRQMARLLQGLGAPAVPDLIKAVDSENRVIAIQAADALGGLGPQAKAAVETLLRAANDEEPLLRISAYWALASIDPTNEKVLAELKKGLVFDKPARTAAMISLAAVSDEVTPLPSVSELLNFMQNMDYGLHPNRALFVVDVLGKIGPEAKDAVPLLKAMKSNPPTPAGYEALREELSRRAAAALEKISPEDAPMDE
jgi:beta-lactamase regulating signal transducer with metallopeptidase domain/protein involved in polysaccharide export with SLBB domain